LFEKDSPKPGDYHLFKGIDEFNKKRYGQALYCFQTASSLLFENEIAMLLVASMYLIGFGNIKKNSYRALEYYKKAAYVHNNRIAQYFVGMMYLEGGRDDASNFIEQDHEAAVIWLNKSAINGWCTAQVRLGLLYQMGDAGLNQDYDQAAYWYKKTAQKYKASRDTLCLFGNKNFQLHFESSGLLKR
jgi:TPR repeat protein